MTCVYTCIPCITVWGPLKGAYCACPNNNCTACEMLSACIPILISTYFSTVVGSSASVEFPDLPSGLTSVRANVKLGRRNRVRTEWEEIMVP